jgi:hypothetical protein
LQVTDDYFNSTFRQQLVSSVIQMLTFSDKYFQLQTKCTFWIRRSSGQLCVDLVPGNIQYPWYGVLNGKSSEDRIKPLDLSNQEAIAIDSLTLIEFHHICFWNLSRYRTFDCSTSATVNLNTIILCLSEDRLKDSIEIALLPDTELYLGDWIAAAGVTGEGMEGGWTRYYNFILTA